MTDLIPKEYVNSEMQIHRQLPNSVFYCPHKMLNYLPSPSSILKTANLWSQADMCSPVTMTGPTSEPCEGLRVTESLSITLMPSGYILCLIFRPFEWLLIPCC